MKKAKHLFNAPKKAASAKVGGNTRKGVTTGKKPKSPYGKTKK